MGGVRLVGWLAPVVGRETVDWDDVYREELPRVYSFFRYRVRGRALAEDLTSTTFEKAWRARHRYRRDRASVGTWLLAIARNVAIDHFRRSRPEVPLEDGAVRDTTTPESEAWAPFSRPCPPASGSSSPSSTGRGPPTAPSRRRPA
jgi:RNA polymerase sigma-70 factor (ECF subfamily)